MLRNKREEFSDSNGIKIDRNAKVRSLLLTKNPEHTLEEEEEEEEIDWPVIKFGQKCFHSSIGSFSSQSQFEQLDDNVFKTPTKETPPIILKAKESQRKVFFDISNSFPSNVNVKDKVQCAATDDRYRTNNDKSELQSTKFLRLVPVIDNNNNNCNINNINNNCISNNNINNINNNCISNNNINNNCISNNSISNNCIKKDNSLGENPQLAIASARLRKIWRYRLGSSGDRVTPSPPHISHKDIKKIKLKKLIGHGGFGAVYLGVFKDKIVAVKRLHKRVKNAKAKLESFRAECNVLNLKHPNIVQVLAASIGDCSQEAVIVMEFAGDRNLLNVINDSKQILDLTRRLKYSMELAKALEFIHSNRVVHLDLKPANVIITSKDECKLGDFGCCRLLRVQPIEARDGSNASTNDDKASPSPFTDGDFSVLKTKPQSTSQLAGTFVYRAPELLKGESPSPLSDVFSLGITMWQMLSRRSPYAGKDKHAVIFGVVAYNVRPSFDFDDESAFDFSGPHCLLSIPRARCFDDYRQYDASFLRPPSAKYDKNVSVGEKRYREIVERCWTANLNDRPWPAELIDAIQNWQY